MAQQLADDRKSVRDSPPSDDNGAITLQARDHLQRFNIEAKAALSTVTLPPS